MIDKRETEECTFEPKIIDKKQIKGSSRRREIANFGNKNRRKRKEVINDICYFF